MSQPEGTTMEKTVYDPAEVEARWYKVWEASGVFGARPDPQRKSFCIVIPPPNITGSLHMGHALNNTIQDILTRTRRMQGFEALWIPGTDHAGIATQAVVEKTLAKEGKTRFDLGREKFVERVWAWREQSGRTIVGQLKRLGASCDWTRERFTMDPQCTLAVREAFYQLFKKGYIYRGKYIVNWCPRCLTALSDLEVEHENDANGKIYHVRYPIDDQTAIVIATTRPETILADTAIAVNPAANYKNEAGETIENPWKHLIGKTATLPLVGRKLPIIADDYVELGFGTGALKVTPAHDANDFAIGQRHKLDTVVVMDEKGKMNAEAGAAYEGLDRFKARTKIVEDLEREGFLVKIEPYVVALGKCYRCHTVLEPYLSDQWFMRMAEIAKPAIDVARDGRVKFYPARFGDLYLRWMENLRDWCIGRQLWWGHRVPVWTCANGHADAYREDPSQCSHCDSTALTQDTDVLDTWFSSALWPLSTLGWPQQTPDLAYFYPTSVLSTDRGILYLWVARMIMMGLEFKNDIPFSDVYIHATVLTKDGRRMSKSLGTGIDPLNLFDQYGTDATRFGLAWMTGQGQDIKFSEERIQMSRNFANKIWNAVRLSLKFLADGPRDAMASKAQWSVYDRWLMSRLQQVTRKVTSAIDEYSFDIVARELYDFFWDEFCDWYLELIKPIYYDRQDAAEQAKTSAILDHVVSSFLRLLHPVMPFITEECWHALPGDRGSIVVAPWPKDDGALIDAEAESRMAVVMDVIRGIRNMRAELGATPREEMEVILVFADEASRQALADNQDALKRLAQVNPMRLVSTLDVKPPAAFSTRSAGGEVFLPMPHSFIGKEVDRLARELQSVEATIDSVRRKLDNASFVEKAKPEVVERERTRLQDMEGTRVKVHERLELMRGLSTQ